MSLSLAGALRAWLLSRELAGIGNDIFRDIASKNAVPPYIIVRDYGNDVPALQGDGRVLARTQLVTAELFQPQDSESDALNVAFEEALDAAVLSNTIRRVLKVRLVDFRGMPDDEYQFVKHTGTLWVTYSRTP